MPKLYSSDFIAKILLINGFLLISQKETHQKFRKIGNPTLTIILPAKKEKFRMAPLNQY